MSVEPRLARHGHVSYLEIPAVDIEQSADFYESVLGWQIHQGQSGHISFDDRSGDLIGRWVTDRVPSREPGLLPYIYVDRIDDVVKRVVKQGGEIVKAPYPEGDLRVATFRDPAGNLMGIWEEAGRLSP
jgi:predicted enzyme related to lactoylglutathione lyase